MCWAINSIVSQFIWSINQYHHAQSPSQKQVNHHTQSISLHSINIITLKQYHHVVMITQYTSNNLFDFYYGRYGISLRISSIVSPVLIRAVEISLGMLSIQPSQNCRSINSIILLCRMCGTIFLRHQTQHIHFKFIPSIHSRWSWRPVDNVLGNQFNSLSIHLEH